jgi:dolichol-phosphate mannosyltransferase
MTEERPYSKPPAVSVVIPVYNEERTLPTLYRELVRVLDGGGDSYELVFVDDGSSDGSFGVLRALHGADGRVRVLRFSRNFGHHIALTAGLDVARGDAVVMMDADLQDPPAEIPKLLGKHREGYHVVYGIRRERHDPLGKRVTSALFWGLLRRFSDVPIPAGQTMLRVLDRRVVDEIRAMRERSRFVHGMMAWVGFDATSVEVDHAPRSEGASKYDVGRMLRLAFHAVTSLSTVPLRLATYGGLLGGVISAAVLVYYLLRRLLFGFSVPGFATIVVAIMFFGAVQLLMLGIIGEYVGRTYREVQGRPLYILRETL